MKRRKSVAAALITCAWLVACHGTPAGPTDAPLAIGRWTGNGACLAVTDTGCNLAVGCGHGQFPRPIVRSNGSFDVEGTYRIEVGPVSIDPAPQAHFSGAITGTRMVLMVLPTSPGLPPQTYSMTQTTAGLCPIPCL